MLNRAPKIIIGEMSAREYCEASLVINPRLYRHDRCYSPPKIPDPATASKAGMQQDVANFPFEYEINALAQEGGKATINGKTYDFTGQGNADQAANVSDQMAQAMLDIQKNYNPDYIKQRLADLQQADPQGFAARKQLFNKIQEDAAKAPPNSQMASDLQNQVNTMLKNSGHLDAKGLEEVQSGVRGGQAARGIVLGNAPTSQEASAVVGASDALKARQHGQAIDYLKSGVSPQDIQFRKIQQDLENLGAFQNNQTPTAQFGELSGTQNGAVPFNPVNYSTPYQLNPQGSGAAGINFANSQFGFQNSQANPWLAGLSLGANTFGAVSNLYGSYGGGSVPSANNFSAFNEFNGIGAPGMTGSGGPPASFSTPLPAVNETGGFSGFA